MNLSKKIEAILLLEKERITIEDIAARLKTTAEEVTASVQVIENKYRTHEHGIEITHTAHGILLLPTKEVWQEVSAHYNLHPAQQLSNTVLETLAIIAYSQPITMIEIEELRGVRSAHSIRVLIEQQLIMVTGIKKAPGNPKLYATTKRFLQLYNLAHIKELPELHDSDKLHFLTHRDG